MLVYVESVLTPRPGHVALVTEGVKERQMQEDVTMEKLDVRRTNDAIERLLEVTENPRHRFLLQTYYRHRYLEIAGRYEEIFVPEMTVEHPIYHFHASGLDVTLEGQEAVMGVYRHWADTNQAVFYAENEQVAVADNFIASVAILYQQKLGKELATAGFAVDDVDAYYLYKVPNEMIWPYDDRGRTTVLRRGHSRKQDRERKSRKRF